MVGSTAKRTVGYRQARNCALNQLEDNLEAWETHAREQLEAIIAFIYTEGASGYYEDHELERGIVVRMSSLGSSLLSCLESQRKLSFHLKKEFGLPVDGALLS